MTDGNLSFNDVYDKGNVENASSNITSLKSFMLLVTIIRKQTCSPEGSYNIYQIGLSL